MIVYRVSAFYKDVAFALSPLVLFGAVGCGGDDGAAGTPGSDGTNGRSVLLTTSDEPPGTQCPEGGKRIDTGIDADDNGVLDASEKTSPTFVCDGTSGKGKDGEGAERIRTVYELAGDRCAYAGIAIQLGNDIDGNGKLDDDEVDASRTSFVCNTLPVWPELRTLPPVTTPYSFSLSVDDRDGSARLGFMFFDDAYRKALLAEHVLWDGDGAYAGENTFAVYELQGAGAQSTWKGDHGRTTPQYYAYSELTFDNGSSYYTTNYSGWGDLISVVKDGGKGVYALTPAFSGRRAHSIAFSNHLLYALIAQDGIGLTFSTVPLTAFGDLDNYWTDLAVIEPSAEELASPKLLRAGDALVGAYVLGGKATIRATRTPDAVTQASDFEEIGSCAGAARVDLAWAGDKLYAACIDTAGNLTVEAATLTSLDAVAWEPVVTGVSGKVDEVDLSALGARIALGVRQGAAVRAYASIIDKTPSFDAVLPGSFDLQLAKEGIILSMCELEGKKIVRTFLR